MTTTIPHLVNRFDVDTDDTFDDLRRRYESLVPTIDFAELTAVIESGDLARVQRYTAQRAPHSSQFLDVRPDADDAIGRHQNRAITYMMETTSSSKRCFATTRA